MISEVEDLKARLDALESWSLKHVSHLYAVVKPAKAVEATGQMMSIYNHTTSPKAGRKPPTPEPDSRLTGMASIYKKSSAADDNRRCRGGVARGEPA